MYRSVQKRFLFVILVLVRILGVLPGQDLPFYSEPRFQRYSVEQGLYSNEILCMNQDQTGYNWVGGVAGLYRFDGNEFYHFPSEDEDIRSLQAGLIFLYLRRFGWKTLDCFSSQWIKRFGPDKWRIYPLPGWHLESPRIISLPKGLWPETSQLWRGQWRFSMDWHRPGFVSIWSEDRALPKVWSQWWTCRAQFPVGSKHKDPGTANGYLVRKVACWSFSPRISD